MSVNLIITGNNIYLEKRFDVNLSLEDFKIRLQFITGIPDSRQLLTLYRGELKLTTLVGFPETKLSEFGVENDCRVDVMDTQPQPTHAIGEFENVPKFEISSEAYEKLDDSVLAFKKRNKLGRFSDESQVDTTSLDFEQIQQQGVEVGKRCEIDLKDGSMLKRGTVRFVGTVEFQSGAWIGVEYDEPVGKNDGSVKNVRYFQCNPNFGGFVKLDKIKVGDYPPLDDLDMDIDDLDEF